MTTRAPVLCLLLAAAALLTAPGCNGACPVGGFDESFKWPADVACPAPSEAALYMAGFESPGECGISMVSVDGPGQHTKDGCTYPVSAEFCSDGCHIN